jgi:lipoyl(octanoyl) transferase
MNIIVRHLGTKDYQSVWDLMIAYTRQRTAASQDEFWLIEHPPTYTLGKAGKEQHILNARDIPVVKSDRGGQVTFHGPGQLVIYTLLDVRRLKIGPRELVRRLEGAVIEYLFSIGIESSRKKGAPGIYVEGAKIAALGLRIRNSFSYHGLAINVDMDLEPFLRINPCGYKDLRVTQIADILLKPFATKTVVKRLLPFLFSHLYQGMGYSVVKKVEFEGLLTEDTTIAI